MSELTRCNACNVKAYEATAKKRGVKLIVQRESHGDMRGWYSTRYSDQDKPFSYMMEITRECCC